MTMEFITFALQVTTVLMTAANMAVGLTYHTKEEMAVGTAIGNIARDEGLTKSLTPERLAELKFNLLVHGYPHTRLFTIGQRSSEIRTKVKLDREDLCGRLTQCILDIVVGVLSDKSDFYQIVPIQVFVKDINDNPPVFIKSILQVPIPESAVSGSMYPVPEAIDLDIGDNIVKKYKLLTPSDLFSLKERTKKDGSVEAFIVLNGTLDREKAEAYQLRIMAEDGGNPPKFGTAILNISITDVNDHKPEFIQSRYEASFSENTKTGTTLLKVEARDSDHGDNGYVTYHFGYQTSKDVLNTFSINEVNGQIQLRKMLDYELSKEYQFTIRAQDHGSQPKSTVTTVMISVGDINDKKPSLHFNMLAGGDFAIVSENAGPLSFMALLSVSDGDSGRNGEVDCRVSPPGFILKQLYGKEYTVLLNRTLDRETRQGYEVRISCQDRGKPTKRGSASFHLEVMDVNDNPPIFQPPNYKKSLLETNRTGQVVIQVFTTDRDAGDNKNVSYSLESFQDIFEVDSIGIIRNKDVLDREMYSQMEVIVVAKDHGKPSLSSTAIVDVELQDVNDNSPHFSKKVYSFDVPEEKSYGTFVGKVSATDADEGRKGQVIYALMSNPMGGTPFTINSLDGTLRMTEALDREVENRYSLVVVAMDNGEDRQQSSMVSVIVNVLDENDNDPVFHYPNSTNNTVEIYHTAYVGTLLTTVNATDRDNGENATIIYRIVSGNERNQFQIDKRSGEIFLVKELYPEEVRQHFLFISASDGGETPRRTSAKLVLNIHLGNVTAVSSPSKGNTAIDSMIIGIALALTAILLAIIIIVTIVIVRIRRRKRTNAESSRAEAEHMMSVSPSDHGGFGINKSPKQPTKDKEVVARGQFSLANEVTESTLPSPTFSTFTGQNTYMASVDHHNNMTYPQDCGAVNIADRVPPDGEDIEMAAMSRQQSADRSTSPPINCCETNTNRTLERDPAKRSSDVPYIMDMQQNSKLDAHSDMSGETTASDSGRGGSEEEIKGGINNNNKGYDKARKAQKKQKKTAQLMTPVLTEEDTVNQRIKTWMAEQDPHQAFYQSPTSCYGNCPINSDNLKAAQFSPTKGSIYEQGGYCAATLPSPASQTGFYSAKNGPSWRGDAVSPMEHKNAAKNSKSADSLALTQLRTNLPRADVEEEESDILNDSTRDDDDGGTTTSGSYVVSPEDICDINELYSTEVPGVDV